MMNEKNVLIETLLPDVANITSVVDCDDPSHGQLVVRKSRNNDDTL
jgi:hypothetical protein